MKKIIPFGDRLLCRRRVIGEKLGAEGLIVAADETADRPTDVADVTYAPEHTFVDKMLLDNAETAVKALGKKMREGDSHAYNALRDYGKFITKMAVRAGDVISISKHVGIDFDEKTTGIRYTLVNRDDVIGLVIDE